MDLQRALAYAADRRNTLLTTLRRDGRPQQSVVFYLLDGDQFTISLTDDRAKVKNLRRDSRAPRLLPASPRSMTRHRSGGVEERRALETPI